MTNVKLSEKQDEILREGGFSTGMSPATKSLTKRAMDTYAKQVAIGFAEWVHRIYIPTATNPKRWYKTGEIDKGRYETEQLYSMYLQTLQTPTNEPD